LRCSKNTQVLKLSDKIFSEVRDRHGKDFHDFLDIIQHAILAKEMKFPLDYSIKMPKYRVPRSIPQDEFARLMGR